MTRFCFTVWELRPLQTPQVQPMYVQKTCLMLDSGMSLGQAHKVTFWYKNNAAFQSLLRGCTTGNGPRAFPGFLGCCQVSS